MYNIKFLLFSIVALEKNKIKKKKKECNNKFNIKNKNNNSKKKVNFLFINLSIKLTKYNIGKNTHTTCRNHARKCHLLTCCYVLFWQRIYLFFVYEYNIFFYNFIGNFLLRYIDNDKIFWIIVDHSNPLKTEILYSLTAHRHLLLTYSI
jgi:hypothetical protein